MDISEITKVASRKMLNADAEKLREKVSRETAKIIKLKVAQDTAYWDLKEKLQQVEGNHERLQQNMVEVQMQHEAISGQYQDEIRLRPDTLNKLSSTREICDVLEEYSERLKDTLSRCKSDQASLCEAYQKSGKLVREIKLQHERSDERNKQIIDNLQEKVNTSNEHQNQLLQYLSAAKRQADTELSESRVKLATAHAQKDELTSAINELGRHLEQSKSEIQMKDSTIANIQAEAKQLLEDFTAEHNAMKCTISKKEKELQEANEAIAALQRAVSNQEEFACGLRADNSQLQEQLAAMEEQLQAAREVEKQLLVRNENTMQEAEALKGTIRNITEKKEDLEKLVYEKNDAIQQAKIKIEELSVQISELETEKTALSSELHRVREQSGAQQNQITELECKSQQLQESLDDLNNTFKTYRDETDANIRELKASIDDKEKELKMKAGTIAQLMCEVGAAAEAAAKLQAALQRQAQQAEDDKQAARERDLEQTRTIEQLQMQVSEKENELSKQMTIILDMRNEKERLQEKIQGMQCKIDNIQKELSEPHPKQPIGDAPELDDNAVAFSLTPRVPPKNKPRSQNVMKSPVLKSHPVNRNESGKLDNMLFSIFSDTSMDGDSNMIDPREVNRRFEALTRGEPVQPASINALKRRKAPSGGLKTIEEEDYMSLSQIKKNLKNDEPRKFFKNARNDNKIKRVK